MRRNVMLVIATLAWQACGSNDTASTPRSDGGKPLPGCKWVYEQNCWDCGTGVGSYEVGCHDTSKCLLFCKTNGMPTGFKPCSYYGPNEGGPACKDWVAPPPPLSICKISQDPAYGPIYGCPGCPALAPAYSAARGPDGLCYGFANTCHPEGFKFDTKCKIGETDKP